MNRNREAFRRLLDKKKHRNNGPSDRYAPDNHDNANPRQRAMARRPHTRRKV